MKASELRSLSSDELDAKTRELRDELFNLQVKQTTGQLESTGRLRDLRRDIARAETVKRESCEATQ